MLSKLQILDRPSLTDSSFSYRPKIIKKNRQTENMMSVNISDTSRKQSQFKSDYNTKRDMVSSEYSSEFITKPKFGQIKRLKTKQQNSKFKQSEKCQREVEQFKWKDDEFDQIRQLCQQKIRSLSQMSDNLIIRKQSRIGQKHQKVQSQWIGLHIPKKFESNSYRGEEYLPRNLFIIPPKLNKIKYF